MTVCWGVPVCLQDVQAAQQEAAQNVCFLEPLRKLLEKLDTMDDFVALSDHFKPLLHSLLLIWKLSSSYSSSARFATLLREICNDLIMQVREAVALGQFGCAVHEALLSLHAAHMRDAVLLCSIPQGRQGARTPAASVNVSVLSYLLTVQACKYVPGSELLQMDPTDAVEKLRTALKVLGGFKLHYIQYKAISTAECPNHPWRFQNSIVFSCLDTFMERCADMLELQSTCMQVSIMHAGCCSCCALC